MSREDDPLKQTPAAELARILRAYADRFELPSTMVKQMMLDVADEIERLTEEVDALRLVATVHDAETARLTAGMKEYACTATAHPCGCYDQFLSERAVIERLRAAVAWTREVRPNRTREGCAVVEMTWDQFNAMRALADPKP